MAKKNDSRKSETGQVASATTDNTLLGNSNQTEAKTDTQGLFTAGGDQQQSSRIPSSYSTNIPLTHITAAEYQVRKYSAPEEDEELRDSIKQYGLLQPIIVHKVGEYYKLLGGYRRWMAAKSLGMQEIPARVMVVKQNEVVIQLEENIRRSNLTPMEEAEALDHLMKFDAYGSLDDLAKIVGKSISWVSRRLNLLGAPTKLQVLVQLGDISAGAASELMEIKNIQRRDEIIDQATGGRMTEGQARAIKEAANSATRQTERPQRQEPEETREAEMTKFPCSLCTNAHAVYEHVTVGKECWERLLDMTASE